MLFASWVSKIAFNRCLFTMFLNVTQQPIFMFFFREKSSIASMSESVSMNRRLGNMKKNMREHISCSKSTSICFWLKLQLTEIYDAISFTFGSIFCKHFFFCVFIWSCTCRRLVGKKIFFVFFRWNKWKFDLTSDNDYILSEREKRSKSMKYYFSPWTALATNQTIAWTHFCTMSYFSFSIHSPVACFLIFVPFILLFSFIN